MKTFKGHASLDFKIVVPDQFIQMFRDAAQKEDASEFHKLMQAKHPENDEAFAEAIISNALRRVLRNTMCDELHSVGLGATVSPVKMELIGMVPDHDAPANPQVVTVGQRIAALSSALAAPYGAEAQASDDPGGALAYIKSGHSPAPTDVLEPLNKDPE